MKKIVFVFIFILTGTNCFAQINCDAVFEKGSPCHRACEMLYNDANTQGRSGVQGARESQIKCDSAISLCPTFADAYYIKAIPYLKRGEFLTWKILIDKAVEYDTITYLGYRGGARFMFLRDYEGAIADIELLKTKTDMIGSIYNGDYHLNCILALSYRETGDTLKCIEILKKQIQSDNSGFFDRYHLGVTLFHAKHFDEAKEILHQQINIYPFADAYYYLALIYSDLSDKHNVLECIQKAHILYKDDITLPGCNSYMDYPDKVYLKQIENKISCLHKY
jgi:tetratricopeptide (TPR) repeat protein